jgi:hypothetical protein
MLRIVAKPTVTPAVRILSVIIPAKVAVPRVFAAATKCLYAVRKVGTGQFISVVAEIALLTISLSC